MIICCVNCHVGHSVRAQEEVQEAGAISGTGNQIIGGQLVLASGTPGSKFSYVSGFEC
jgi:hypothetical protein